MMRGTAAVALEYPLLRLATVEIVSRRVDANPTAHVVPERRRVLVLIAPGTAPGHRLQVT